MDEPREGLAGANYHYGFPFLYIKAFFSCHQQYGIQSPAHHPFDHLPQKPDGHNGELREWKDHIFLPKPKLYTVRADVSKLAKEYGLW